MALRLPEEVSLSWEAVFIDSQVGLSDVLEVLKEEEFLPIDTETAGWQTGNDYLCLLQIGAVSKKRVYVIDALKELSLEPLKGLFESPDIPKIAHNVKFESRILAKVGIQLQGLVDTINLAKEFRPDLPSYKLSTCAKVTLGKTISKELQTSDWSTRPLTKEQLEYAALDVEITTELYQAFKKYHQENESIETNSPEELMRELYQVSKERFEMLEPIAEKYYSLQVKETFLKEKLKILLGELGENYEGEFGKANYTNNPRKIIDPNLLRQELPELASELIEEKVLKKTFLATIKENGIDRSILDRVERVVSEGTERVYVKVKDWIVS